jgi:hypothetical protein
MNLRKFDLNHSLLLGISALTIATLLYLCGAPGSANAQSPKTGELRLNDIQVTGSHNSYRIGVSAAVLEYLGHTRRDAAQAFNYGNPPLSDQLDIGLRQIEIDAFADPEGGRFAKPFGETFAPGAFDIGSMSRPGFKVMHIPGLDYRVSCVTLIACLAQVRDWSKAHPDHLPIFITIDSKDQPFNYPNAIAPVRLTPHLLDSLDAEIRSVFGRDMLITPDDVRGGHQTLKEAVLAGGWPSLTRARGKVMFIFDVVQQTADLYRLGHSSLGGRAMFSLYPETDPEAATFIVQDPRGKVGYIQQLVKKGYIVRTRSDADMREGPRQDYSGWHAAENSGAQMISTDYYVRPNSPNPRDFRLSFKGGAYTRCNPVRVKARCNFGRD